jgi:hypothetical protein
MLNEQDLNEKSAEVDQMSEVHNVECKDCDHLKDN